MKYILITILALGFFIIFILVAGSGENEISIKEKEVATTTVTNDNKNISLNKEIEATTMESEIEKIEIKEHDMEGGGLSLTYYRTGYVEVKGRKSGLGYEPQLEDGWYAIESAESLKRLFESATRIVNTYVPGKTNQTFGMWHTATFFLPDDEKIELHDEEPAFKTLELSLSDYNLKSEVRNSHI